jgi:hypothetical protein
LKTSRPPGGLVGEGDLRDLELDGAGVVVDRVPTIPVIMRLDVIIEIVIIVRTL